MDVHPLPGSSGCSSGVKVARIPRRRATSRTTSLSTTLRSAAPTPSVARTGISNWWGANSARTAPARTRLHQCADRLSRERFGAPQRIQREGCRGRLRRKGRCGRLRRGGRHCRLPRERSRTPLAAEELELVLEACDHTRAELALQLRERVARKRRGQHSHGVPSVSTMSHNTSSRRIGGSKLHAHVRVRDRAAVSGPRSNRTACARRAGRAG